MNRRFLVALGMGLSTAFVLASACTVTSSEDDENVTASSTTAPSSTTGSSQGGAGVGGGAGGAGVGGGGDCIGCNEYINSDATEDQLCGFNQGACDPGSSCELALLLSECVCGDPGACANECVLACTGSGMDTDQCGPCVNTNCAPEQADCDTDLDGTGG